jgi:hypothetical protein
MNEYNQGNGDSSNPISVVNSFLWSWFIGFNFSWLLEGVNICTTFSHEARIIIRFLIINAYCHLIEAQGVPITFYLIIIINLLILLFISIARRN